MLFYEYDQRILINDDEPGRFLTTIDGTVGKYAGDDDETVEFGTFKLFIVHAEQACDEEEPLWNVFDSDAALTDYYALYQDEGMEFSTAVQKALKIEGRWKPNMLVLDRLEIRPEHRGVGDGLRILRSLMQRFALGCGIVAMKPFPIQFEHRSPAENSTRPEFIAMRMDQFATDQKKAEKKLYGYYARLGFKRVPGTPLMVFDPDQRIPAM